MEGRKQLIPRQLRRGRGRPRPRRLTGGRVRPHSADRHHHPRQRPRFPAAGDPRCQRRPERGRTRRDRIPNAGRRRRARLLPGRRRGGPALSRQCDRDDGCGRRQHEIPLVGGDPWISENTGSAATDSEMVNVLSNLSGLQIRGEFRSGSDSSGIDNVVLNVASLREIPPVASLSSTFDTDAEGWRTVGDADGPTYQNSDGNPDGHLSATDPTTAWTASTSHPTTTTLSLSNQAGSSNSRSRSTARLPLTSTLAMVTFTSALATYRPMASIELSPMAVRRGLNN